MSTVFDALRSRLTGTHSGSALTIETQRFLDQTQTRSPSNPDHKEEDTTVEEYKELSRKILEYLLQTLTIASSLEIGGIVHQKHRELLALAQSPHRFTSDTFQDPKNKALHHQVVLGLLQKITLLPNNPEHAWLVETVGLLEELHIEDTPSYKRQFPQLVHEIIQKEDFATLKELLQGPLPLALESFSILQGNLSLHQHINRETSQKIMTHIPSSLVVLITQEVARGSLESVREKIQYLDAIGKQFISRHDEFRHESNRSFNFSLLATQFIQAISQKTDNITGGYPSHATCAIFLETLQTLHSCTVTNQETPHTPPELTPLLHKIYQEKVIPYSHRDHLNYLHDRIIRIAGRYQIAPETITVP